MGRSPDQPPAPVDQLAVDREVVEEPPAGPEEVFAVAVGVEGDNICAEEAVEDLLPPGQPGEDLGWRERHVQEESDRPVGRPPPAQELGHEHQLVVVDPAQCRSSGSGDVGGGKTRVDGAVDVPPVAVVDGLLDQAVQERPECPVRESVVVGVDLATAEDDRAEVDVDPLDAPGRVAPSPSQPTQAPPPRPRAGVSALTSPPDEGFQPRLPLVTGSLFEYATIGCSLPVRRVLALPGSLNPTLIARLARCSRLVPLALQRGPRSTARRSRGRAWRPAPPLGRGEARRNCANTRIRAPPSG